MDHLQLHVPTYLLHHQTTYLSHNHTQLHSAISPNHRLAISHHRGLASPVCLFPSQSRVRLTPLPDDLAHTNRVTDSYRD
jgi:hypothetical protein